MALRVEAWNGEPKGLSDLPASGQRRDFVARQATLHRRHDGLRPDQRIDPGDEITQRSEGPANDQVGALHLAMRQTFYPLGVNLDVCERQLQDTLTEEGRFLSDWFDQMNDRLRPGNRQHDSRQAPTAADVDDRRERPLIGQRTDDRETVEQMLDQHRIRIADGGQVVDGIPLRQQAEVIKQSTTGGVVQRQAERVKAAIERLAQHDAIERGVGFATAARI